MFSKSEDRIQVYYKKIELVFIGDSTLERLRDSILEIPEVILADNSKNIEDMEFWKFAFFTENSEADGEYHNYNKSSLYINENRDLLMLSMFGIEYKLHISSHSLEHAVSILKKHLDDT